MGQAEQGPRPQGGCLETGPVLGNRQRWLVQRPCCTAGSELGVDHVVSRWQTELLLQTGEGWTLHPPYSFHSASTRLQGSAGKTQGGCRQPESNMGRDISGARVRGLDAVNLLPGVPGPLCVRWSSCGPAPSFSKQLL